MEIREATIDDSDAIFDLANQLHESLNVARTEFQLMFEEILQRQASICFVSSIELNVVGYIAGSVHPVLVQGGNSAYIDEIVVLPDFRGRGIGTELMSQMEHWAREHQCGLAGLATGGATLFYEKLGYQSRAGYYKKYL